MNFIRRIFGSRGGLAAAVLVGSLSVVGVLRAEQPDSDLKFVLIMERHGVRPPLASDTVVTRMSALPWPKWEVPAEFLTPHGAQALALLGAYYRELYISEGLLTGNPSIDFPRVFLRADTDERNIVSARRVGEALLPGTQPQVISLPQGSRDPLFKPMTIPNVHPDTKLGVEAVLGRIGHDVPAVVQAHQGTLDLLQHILFGPDGKVPPGKISPLSLAPWVGPEPSKSAYALVSIEPFHKCMTITEDFLLEYLDGKPMQDVGWGRVTPATLTRLLELHSLYWDLSQRTLYPAQVQVSNIAAHIFRSIDQAVTGQPETGAFGGPETRLVVISGHDTNLANLGGLLGINWTVPGTQMNPTLPGSALVFELRQRRSDGQYLVRVQFVSQTMDQIRNLTPLSLEHPPFTAPIFIPDCSGSAPGSDVPYEKFKALMTRVIDPEFTAF